MKYEIQLAASGRRTKVWRVIGRDENGTLRYRGLAVYNKRTAQAIADSFNDFEELTAFQDHCSEHEFNNPRP